MKNKMKQKWMTLGLGLLMFVQAQAQFEPTDKLVSNQREERAEFGTAVSVKNNYAVVGASRETIATGAAYFYRYNEGEWHFLEHLTAPDGHEMAEFGGAVKVLDNHLIIASGRADLGNLIRAGAVYVYDIMEDGMLSAPTKLIASDAMNDGMFGMHVTSLDAAGNTLAVGAPGENTWTGAVYLFEYQDGEWTETQKLQSPTAQQFDTFGISVSIHEDQLVIGANETNNRRGEAHVFQKDIQGSWEYVQTLTPSLSSPDSFFGTGVAVFGNVIAVGAYGNSTSGGESIFIFEKNISGDWEETQIITGPVSSEDTFFGWDCKIQDDRMIVSAPHIYGFEEGQVFLYQQDENGIWEEDYSLNQQTNIEESFFGWNIAMDQAHILVGAPREDYDDSGANYMMDAGATFIFTNPELLSVPSYNVSSNSLMYPVPATDFATVENNVFGLSKVTLYNAQGRLLQNFDGQGNHSLQLPVDYLPKGIYFVSVTTNNGATTTHKLIKKD